VDFFFLPLPVSPGQLPSRWRLQDSDVTNAISSPLVSLSQSEIRSQVRNAGGELMT
jgi:hypothetical protein